MDPPLGSRCRDTRQFARRGVSTRGHNNNRCHAPPALRMSSKGQLVAVVSSAHWSGDPRLNRHAEYIEESGRMTTLTFPADGDSRIQGTLRALRSISNTVADVVILPDPELFVLGSLAARLMRKKPVIDIHEDYGKAAAARSWIPELLRPVLGLASRLLVGVGRILAWRVVVAAPELAKSGDIVVVNVPNPEMFVPTTSAGTSSQLVYVGDVTIARGALDMVEVLGNLDTRFDLCIIGHADNETERLMRHRAAQLGATDRLTLTGRLPHDEAWSRAAGSSAGLSLLQPAPAYRQAVATKLWEYMAAGIPPIVSDLPGQAAIVKQIHPDLVCSSPQAAATIATRLKQDQAFRESIVSAGIELVSQKWIDLRPDLAIQGAIAP